MASPDLQNYRYDPTQEVKLTLKEPSTTPNPSNSKGFFGSGPAEERPASVYHPVPAENFKLRGKRYLTDKAKIPSTEAAFELLNFFLIKSPTALHHVAQNLSSLRNFLASFPEEFFFVAVRQVPTSPKTTAVTIARKRRDENSDSTEAGFEDLLSKYLKEDDAFKNKRLKYIAKLSSAPWAVMASIKALGGEKPVILGNGYLKQWHYTGDNYYEVDVDISSSFVARKIAGSFARFAASFKVQECFVVEGQSPDELPERALVSYSLMHLDLKHGRYELTAEDEEFYRNNPTPNAADLKE